MEHDQEGRCDAGPIPQQTPTEESQKIYRSMRVTNEERKKLGIAPSVSRLGDRAADFRFLNGRCHF